MIFHSGYSKRQRQYRDIGSALLPQQIIELSSVQYSPLVGIDYLVTSFQTIRLKQNKPQPQLNQALMQLMQLLYGCFFKLQKMQDTDTP